jgi:Ca2+/Na+ antiporter
MLNKYIRFLIIFVSLIAVVFGIIHKNVYVVAGGVLLCTYMIYAYFKYASVNLAFKKIRKKELKSAYNLLIDTPNPKLLTKGGKTYYYWGMGIIKISENSFKNPTLTIKNKYL